MIGILIDPETGDLQIKDKSLVIGDNTEGVAESVLRAARGEFKEFPLLGAEVEKLTNSIPGAMWAADAKTMLEAAGVPAKRVTITDGQINIE